MADETNDDGGLIKYIIFSLAFGVINWQRKEDFRDAQNDYEMLQE